MGDDWKAEKVSSSALIPVGGTNFASMNDASQIDTLRMTAPGIHHSLDRAIKASGKHIEELAVPQQERILLPVKRKASFGVGTRVINAKGRKLTIIQANAGYTKKTRTPVHKLADTNGNIYLEKETDLKSIY